MQARTEKPKLAILLVQYVMEPGASLSTVLTFAVHPKIGVGMNVGAIRELEDFVSRYVQKSEICQFKVVFEELIANIAGVLVAHKNGPAFESGQSHQG